MEYLDNVVPLFPNIRVSDGSPVFKDLADAWLAATGRKRVCPENEERHIRHLAPLWRLSEEELRPGVALDVLDGLSGRLGSSTINKVRGTGRRIIRYAMLKDRWSGPNPFDVVDRLPEPQAVHRTLTIEEVRAVMPHIREDRRRQAYLMLYLGCRPGEMKALRREDVDLPGRSILIRRSNGRDSTKTGKQRQVPIPEGLVPHLRAALLASPDGCPFVFPATMRVWKDGRASVVLVSRRQRDDAKLAYMLRTALRAAGLVTGYEHFCRRKDCGLRDIRKDCAPSKCSKCNYKMTVLGVPLNVRFYDLRHSSATLHHQAGADPLAIQIALGHAPASLTQSLYTHLSREDVRRELNKLKI